MEPLGPTLDPGPPPHPPRRLATTGGRAPWTAADLARAVAVMSAAAAAVYTAVWPHELGHAIAARLLGCRPGWWPTGVTPWLAGSRPGGIDPACVAARGRGAVAAVALAGIAVNLALASLAALGARRSPRSAAAARLSGRPSGQPSGRTRRVLLLLVALANAAEALSYLVPNALWPRSDMAAAVAAAGVGRLPWLAAGLLLSAAAVPALRSPLHAAAAALASPGLPTRAWRWGLVLYAAAVMAAAVGSRWRFG